MQLQEEYIAAINTALGVRGEFKPLIKGELTESTNGDGEVDDLDILP